MPLSSDALHGVCVPVGWRHFCFPPLQRAFRQRVNEGNAPAHTMAGEATQQRSRRGARGGTGDQPRTHKHAQRATSIRTHIQRVLDGHAIDPIPAHALQHTSLPASGRGKLPKQRAAGLHCSPAATPCPVPDGSSGAACIEGGSREMHACPWCHACKLHSGHIFFF